MKVKKRMLKLLLSNAAATPPSTPRATSLEEESPVMDIARYWDMKSRCVKMMKAKHGAGNKLRMQ
jgi:hypothetical protein